MFGDSNMRFINLTNREITILKGDETITFPRPSLPARANMSRVIENEVETETGLTIPITVTTFGNVQNLPPQKEGVAYIVSYPVAKALQGQRSDVYIVEDLIRDASGNIIGARSLSRAA